VTAHFGKWHNECIKPAAAGYDVLDGENNGNGPGDFQDDGKTPLPDDDPKRIFSLSELTNEFMREQVEAGKPFYVQLSHYADAHLARFATSDTRQIQATATSQER
jgi:hypothetical protein